MPSRAFTKHGRSMDRLNCPLRSQSKTGGLLLLNDQRDHPLIGVALGVGHLESRIEGAVLRRRFAEHAGGAERQAGGLSQPRGGGAEAARF